MPPLQSPALLPSTPPVSLGFSSFHAVHPALLTSTHLGRCASTRRLSCSSAVSGCMAASPRERSRCGLGSFLTLVFSFGDTLWGTREGSVTSSFDERTSLVMGESDMKIWRELHQIWGVVSRGLFRSEFVFGIVGYFYSSPALLSSRYV
jgi:hypothetical protein